MVFSNISAISWQLVLLVEETGVPGENYRQLLVQPRALEELEMNLQKSLPDFRCFSSGSWYKHKHV